MSVLDPQMKKQAELIRDKRELEQLKIKQELEWRREQEKQILDTTQAPPKIDPNEELNEYIGELEKLTAPRPPKPMIICGTLTKLIPYAPEEIILVGARSGRGKSTVVANLCSSLSRQNHRVLVISNEEPKRDVRHRIGCIELGIDLGKVKDRALSEQELHQLAEIGVKYIDLVHVIDFSYRGNADYVTTIDGFKYIWSGIDFSQYSAIIIDYYQNVTRDTRVPQKSINDVQAEFVSFLDQQKNVIGIPIFLLAQLKPFSDQGKEFEERLKGRKIVFDKATFIIELATNQADYTSKWLIHKDRSRGRTGKSVTTGFDWVHSSFVDYTPDFRQKRDFWVAQRLREDPNFRGMDSGDTD
jgi:hypothetical protein